MQTTANFGLKKPEDTDPAEIQDFNDNADIIDREMAKKADKTGDGSDMTAKFSQVEKLVNLVSGEKLKTSLGKVMKAIADLMEHIGNKNMHVKYKKSIARGTDWNTIKEEGQYSVGEELENYALSESAFPNCCAGAYSYGVLHVQYGGHPDLGDKVLAQTYYPHMTGTTETDGGGDYARGIVMCVRKGMSSGRWTPWKYVYGVDYGEVETSTYGVPAPHALLDKGDIAATRVGSFTASAASYPVPAANDTMKVFGGKIAKFFGDIRNAATGACFIGQIVNNCVTNNAKLPLSAAQGKALMDLFTKLNSDFDTKLQNQLKKVPCRLDRETTEIIFYKSCGIVCVQLSFALAWNINKDVSDIICTIPSDFIPSLTRWLTDNTFNSGKTFTFGIRKNTNGVMCLYLNAAEALVAGDTINTSFLYQLY